MSRALAEQAVSRSDRGAAPFPVSRLRTWVGHWRVILSSRLRFGAYFFLSAMVIILAFLIYNQIFVVEAMRQDARKMIERYAFFYSIATRDHIDVKPGPDLDIIFDTITNTNFPVVITDQAGEPQLWKAIGVSPGNPADLSQEDRQKLRDIVHRLDMENPPYSFEIPKIGSRVLHYGETPLVKRLSWLPFVALCVTILFIGVAYVGFQHIRSSEQRSIWVGMARETAHQLGTPLSSLYGWIELMKAESEDVPGRGDGDDRLQFKQIVSEMEKDTGRLNKIASRFSQIGSTPELRLGSLNEVIAETANYLLDRLPRNVEIVQLESDVPPLPMNRELLGWAFENLLKNAADAMEGKGGRIEISTEAHPEGECVDILVHDNGKGIPHHLTRQIFLPGYSTKKRGWGLGLAFVKRIVEDYHRGRITVRESAPGVGTTFAISLPTGPRETRDS